MKRLFAALFALPFVASPLAAQDPSPADPADVPSQGPDGEPRLATMSLDAYHDRFGEPRAQGFREREIHREVRRLGNVVHVMRNPIPAELLPGGEGSE